MYRPRIIPVLLLKGDVLVKSVEFKKYNYIGDPINAVRIFNDLKADELVFLDIEASGNNSLISLEFIKNVGEEANMPFSVGGGIKTLKDIEAVIQAGAERAIINTAAITDPNFIKQACDEFGSSTISVCMDVKKKFLKGNVIWTANGTKSSSITPLEHAKHMEQLGVGELIIQSISNDGKMTGYDLGLIEEISSQVTIPTVALGGAGSFEDLKKANQAINVNGLAAGSIFVYHGTKKGVLINYPETTDLTV